MIDGLSEPFQKALYRFKDILEVTWQQHNTLLITFFQLPMFREGEQHQTGVTID